MLMHPMTGEMKEDLSLDTTRDHLSFMRKAIQAILDSGKKECLIQVQTWGEKQQAISVREGNEM